MITTTVSIPGMHCEGCAALIKDVSSEFPSVQKVEVDLSSKRVAIDHEEAFDLQKWSEEIEALDETYKVHPIT